jgi:DNA-binding PadR family transcriptional regulator
MRDGDWGPARPDRPEWGPGTGRGPGRRGGDRGDHGERSERGERGDRGERSERGERGYRGRGGWGRSDGPFPPFGPPFGRLGGPGGHLGGKFDRSFGRGPRARKGDVRAAILDLLAEGGQWNGYQLIQEIAGRTSGVWRPSAGSVYPALQQLEDEGLIAPEGEGRRRMYALTDEGRTYAEEHADELNSAWDAAAGMTDDEAMELGDLIRQVMVAVLEVRRAGSPEQLAQARAVLAQTRRSMYRILAEDEPAETATGAGAAPAEPTGGSSEPADTPDDGE